MSIEQSTEKVEIITSSFANCSMCGEMVEIKTDNVTGFRFVKPCDTCIGRAYNKGAKEDA